MVKKSKRAVVKQRGSNEKRPVPKNLQGKGFDAHPEHINRKGRIIPKDVRELNAVIDELFAEEVTDAYGNRMDKLRIALNRLLLSKTPAGAIHILDRRFGKIVEAIDITSKGEKIGWADFIKQTNAPEHEE